MKSKLESAFKEAKKIKPRVKSSKPVRKVAYEKPTRPYVSSRLPHDPDGFASCDAWKPGTIVPVYTRETWELREKMGIDFGEFAKEQLEQRLLRGLQEIVQ